MAGEQFDLILTDIRMADLDGRALYQEIERRWPERARSVVFITATRWTQVCVSLPRIAAGP
jgi:two-component system NtrC family sensor kinase